MSFEELLEQVKRQVWDVAMLNRSNPLGYHLLDAHFNTILDHHLEDIGKLTGVDSNE